MKKKNIVLLALSAFAVVGVGGAALALHQGPAKETVAVADQTYNLVGTHNGWNTSDNTDTVTDGGETKTIEFAENQLFKFCVPGTWDGALGYSELRGNARGYFGAGADNNNIKCVRPGEYKVTIKDSLVYLDMYTSYETDAYVQLNNWSSTYCYAWDSATNEGYKLEPLGAWPGTLVTDVTNGVNFAPNYSAGGGIGKITVPYIGLTNTKLIFHNNSGTQTKDLTLYRDYYYFESTDALYGDDIKGAAAKVVMLWDHTLAEATNQSLCTLSKDQADACIAAYEGSYATAMIENTTFYTWSDKTRTGQKNYTGAELLVTLNKISNGTLALTLAPHSSVSPWALYAALGSIVLGVGAFGFFYFRKKAQK